MRKKITFIGAGSLGFTRDLVRDILTFESFRDAEIVLMDVNAERLEAIRRCVERIVMLGRYPAFVSATTDRTKALEGADGVLITIRAGGESEARSDIEIPASYGVDINLGDTRGPSGVFRGIRLFIPMLEICTDIRKYCPEAIVLNYTNPMAILCRMMKTRFPELKISGLCHSVQKTAAMLTKWIGANENEITYQCAGVNHQAFFIEFKRNGKNAIPMIRRAIQTHEELYNAEPVRNEMFFALGYYPTESSGHNSEYNAWFRKRPDLIQKYCTHGTGRNPGLHAYGLNAYLRNSRNWRKYFAEWEKAPYELARGNEYAASIFNAVFGDGTLFKFNGNVINHGLIESLPCSCCVEIPVLASKNGLEPVKPSPLPVPTAALVSATVYAEEMAAEGMLSGNPEMIFQSILFDPLTAAVLCPAEIREMVNKMFCANRKYLSCFKKKRAAALRRKQKEKSNV